MKTSDRFLLQNFFSLISYVPTAYQGSSQKISHIKNNTGQNNVFRNERIKELSKGGNTELKCHCCPYSIKT